MPQRNRKAFRLLSNQLAALPRWFRQNTDSIELGSNYADLSMAASLLSRTAVLRPDLSLGTGHEPATLKTVIRKIDLPTGKVFCIFLLAGDPVELRTRCWLFGGRMLYIHPADRRIQLDRLMDLYDEAREHAERKYEEFQRGTDHGKKSVG